MNKTIWPLRDHNGQVASTFSSRTYLGTHIFKNIFKAQDKATIVNVIHTTLHFPLFIDDEGKKLLMFEVLEDELKKILHSFQKDKSPRLDGWGVEFFLRLF